MLNTYLASAGHHNLRMAEVCLIDSTKLHSVLNIIIRNGFAGDDNSIFQ